LTALSRYRRPPFFYHPTATATATSAAAASAKRWFNIPLVRSLLASTARCKKKKKKKAITFNRKATGKQAGGQDQQLLHNTTMS